MNIQQMTAKTGRNVRSAFRFAKTSIQRRCAQAVDSHRHTAPRDGFPDSEDKSGSRLPENQRDERRRRGNQQRQVRDQLELLRRVVVTGIARRAGEGMRMDENVSVDPVDMRKQRDTAPIPHKEQQEQRRRYVSSGVSHRARNFMHKDTNKPNAMQIYLNIAEREYLRRSQR